MGVEHVFTFGQSRKHFESNWTHFALKLEFEDGRIMHADRHDWENVRFCEWSEPPEDSIESITLDCEEQNIDRSHEEVEGCMEHQRTMNYSFTSKNCKHFVCDFFHYCQELIRRSTTMWISPGFAKDLR